MPSLEAVHHPAQRQEDHHLDTVHPVEGTGAPAQVVRIQPAHAPRLGASARPQALRRALCMVLDATVIEALIPKARPAPSASSVVQRDDKPWRAFRGNQILAKEPSTR